MLCYKIILKEVLRKKCKHSYIFFIKPVELKQKESVVGSTTFVVDQIYFY